MDFRLSLTDGYRLEWRWDGYLGNALKLQLL